MLYGREPAVSGPLARAPGSKVPDAESCQVTSAVVVSLQHTHTTQHRSSTICAFRPLESTAVDSPGCAGWASRPLACAAPVDRSVRAAAEDGIRKNAKGQALGP